MLVVMIGLPASGKTTWAERNFRTLVSPDRIRLEEFGTEFDEAIEDDVWSLAYGRTREALEADDVVCFDATSLSRTRRRRLLAIARDAGAPAIAVWMDTPRHVAWRRNRERDRSVPRGSFAEMVVAFEPPSEDEGFAAVVRIEEAVE
ncbi:MAG: AAA family ATPase [Longimicrobiales bacterium]|nr:AAA family ATPase [Longimicrobiales bacterium]